MGLVPIFPFLLPKHVSNVHDGGPTYKNLSRPLMPPFVCDYAKNSNLFLGVVASWSC